MEKLVRVDEAAKILNLSKSRVYVLSAQGKIPSYKRGGGNILFFKKEELHHLIMSQCLIEQPIKKTYEAISPNLKVSTDQSLVEEIKGYKYQDVNESDEQKAIDLLKSKGYKITKTVEV